MPSRMKSKTNYQMASWIANFIKHSPLPPTPSPPAPIQPTGVYKNTTGEFIPF